MSYSSTEEPLLASGSGRMSRRTASRKQRLTASAAIEDGEGDGLVGLCMGHYVWNLLLVLLGSIGAKC